MRAMTRREFTIASALSLVLCGGAALAWVNSFNLEYFPPGFGGFKWKPISMTGCYQLLALCFAGSAITFYSLGLRKTGKQARRRRSGQCVACGYDLRASTEHCPECGTPIPKAASVGSPRT